MPANFIGWPVIARMPERCAAAHIAVKAGEDDAGDADLFVELPGNINGILAGQRVGDQAGSPEDWPTS